MDVGLRRRLNAIIWLLGALLAAIIALVTVTQPLGLVVFAIAFFVISILIRYY